MKLLNVIKAIKKPEKFVWSALLYLNKYLPFLLFREKKVSYGTENKDKTFYIIGYDSGWCGIMRMIVQVLSHLEYADKYGYIPVVDFQNFHNQYLDENNFGKENAWEYFLKQPSEYSLKNIKKNANIIYSGNIISPTTKAEFFYNDLFKKDRIDNFRRLFKKYIRFNDETTDYINEKYNFIIGNKKNILGILCRGTDFTLKQPPFHPIQPTTQQVMEKAEEVMKKYNCSHIFLATEDNNIFNIFAEKFGDKLLFVEQRRYSSRELEKSNAISQIESNTMSDKRKLALDYLSSIYILSKLKYFIGGVCGGTQGVYLMSKGFEYDYLWNLGEYPPAPVKSEFKRFLAIISRKRGCLCENY